ncbi:hypothetical protein DUI87_09241 [Hirundo rustica rustica]|uniref:Uncharacterized protein n=1 Tax=Hirundo rustica rustica TaxID=333673 RepID=A0A3M0KNG6_HIRRU|nr:hypothetical protein DUI87_09241 [Hirundo rustica rustica]
MCEIRGAIVTGHYQTYGLTQLQQFYVSMPVSVNESNEVERDSKKDGKTDFIFRKTYAKFILRQFLHQDII